MPAPSSNPSRGESGRVPGVTYWRVEGSLLEISALRSVGFFNWNSQSFLERWVRRAGMIGMGLLRPPAYLASRTFATRLLHGVLGGITRDRLDLLGEEYFQYELKPRMRREAVDKLIEAIRSGDRVILVSQLLEHILRPMTEYFGAAGFLANRLEFRGGEATGRVFGTNEAYDPKSDTWEVLTPMPIPRHGLHGATAAVIGNMVHVPGGGPLPGGSVQGAYHDAFTFS